MIVLTEFRVREGLKRVETADQHPAPEWLLTVLSLPTKENSLRLGWVDSGSKPSANIRNHCTSVAKPFRKFSDC